jgi:HTH-type transcriptional regulator/antitoxin HigA
MCPRGENIVADMNIRRRTAKLTDSYFDLVKQHPLRSIRDEAELDAAQAVIEALLRRKLDTGEAAYLDALSDLVIKYEQDHHAIAPLPPHELLTQMMLERGMTQAELVRLTGIAKATINDLASGKRSFTVEHMHRIATEFGLPAPVFMASRK